ncbi:TPA: hypothetical protein ACU1QO_002524 [Staphylococcus aureus]
MKRLLGLLLASTLILGACGESGKKKQESKNYTTNDIVKGFKDNKLNVSNEKEMTREDFGLAPMKTDEAKMFVVQDDKNARVMKFKNSDDLKQTKKYYDELGKESAAFYSHTHSKGKFLIQMNGDIDDATFNKYKNSMDKTLK